MNGSELRAFALALGASGLLLAACAAPVVHEPQAAAAADAPARPAVPAMARGRKTKPDNGPQIPPPPQPDWDAVPAASLVLMGFDPANPGATWDGPVKLASGAADDPLSGHSSVSRALSVFRDFDGTATLGARFDHIDRRAARTPPVALTGLGGLYGEALLETLKDTTRDDREDDRRGQRFNSNQTLLVEIKGQIDPGGYFFSTQGCPQVPNAEGVLEQTGNGHLHVWTKVKVTRQHRFSNGVPNRIRELVYFWKVAVSQCGFRIVAIGDRPSSEPFPGTMAFTPDMITRINAKGFRYKLWAQGDRIDVMEVWRQGRKTRGANPKLKLLPNRGPTAALYADSPDNCVDMMFVNDPASLPSSRLPDSYCLGRCAAPMIVNTGE